MTILIQATPVIKLSENPPINKPINAAINADRIINTNKRTMLEPSTNFIGVEADGDDIRTMISGDELDIFRQTADTLPALYGGRETAVKTADRHPQTKPTDIF